MKKLALKVARLKMCIAAQSSRKPVSVLRSATCHTGSHGVACHPTQVNAPHLNPSHTGRYSVYPGLMEDWVDLGGGLYTEMTNLSAG